MRVFRTVGLVIVVVGAVGIIVTAAPRQNAEPPTLRTVLERTAAYADQFKQRLSGIVAEEIYVQDIVQVVSKLRPEVTHRVLKSDLLLVQIQEAGRYVEFRDVAEVDGRPVRDRQERLTSLFLNQQSSGDQFQQIITESARYNIGRIRRNVNTPLLAMMFLDPQYQRRFNFALAPDRRPALADRGPADAARSPVFSVSTEVWVIEYREKTDGRTIIRSPEGRAMPASGRFWINPDDGRLLMTELIAGDGSLRATINVSYQSQPLLGFSVPAEMRERYNSPELTISGTATYGNFRRFDVKVQEAPLPASR